MRGTLFRLLPLLLLASCTTTKGIHTQFVDRPVITIEKCVKKEDIPTPPAPLRSQPAPKDLEDMASKAMGKVGEWEQYGHKTDQILKKCSE